MKVRPSGPAHWLFPKTGVQQWHLVTCASFEDRCVAVTESMLADSTGIASSSIFRIVNPNSDQWAEALPLVDKNLLLLERHLSSKPMKVIGVHLLDAMSVLITGDPLRGLSATSVVLDITSMPKRFFLFAFKRLMESPAVKDLVVTYARARVYPEIPLCENALPPAAFQGFGRIEPLGERARLIVGVGFVPLSVNDLLERAKKVKLDFIFPFPPASPAIRRNWRLLSMLLPEGEVPRETEIHRIHSLDAFEVCERILSWSQGGRFDIDMIPLGPKPHALGMAMAYMRLSGRGEIIYSQPQAYGAKYSEGVALDDTGRPQIAAYCVKKAGQHLF